MLRAASSLRAACRFLAACCVLRGIPESARSVDSGLGTRSAPRAPSHPQTHRAADDRALIGGDHERGVVVPREPGEPERHRTRERWPAVEHDQAECPAPQQDVGTPGDPIGVRRPDDPETPRPGDRRPVPRRERARPVDIGDPPAVRDGRRDELPGERRPAASWPAEDLGEPPARQSPRGQRPVDRGDAGGNGGRPHPRRGHEHGELLAERGERHESLGAGRQAVRKAPVSPETRGER